MKTNVYVTAAVRTAIGSFGGSLKDVSAVDLAATVFCEAQKRAGLSPEQIDEVILGNVLQAGLGMNPARQAALKASLPVSVPSHTVNKVCGSGLKAVALACQAIQSEDAGIILAGGVESMSGAPYLLPRARWGYRLGSDTLVDCLLAEGLTCPMGKVHMGVTAENIARRYGIARERQDAFAAASQARAAAARAAGRFHKEIVPVKIPSRQGELLFEQDEYIRPDTTVQKLAQLRPAFEKDGTVTAGNASGINDGAAAVVVGGEAAVTALKREPLARIVAYASAGVDPSLMGMGPVPAVNRALEKAGMRAGDIDLFELNEAFAVQSLAVLQELHLDPERVNVNGGAIALGHPIGCSGARILVTLLYALADHGLKRGLAGLCIGGGQGMAMIVERP
ncbi:MAG: acetyl-CoA C-acetyltransferase [Acidobacteria bacterium]|nr:acetyl-CoA C-acetyltransferase [Acidobacteriota bacterium]